MATIKLDELYSTIGEHWNDFTTNHEQHSRKGNKAAGTRARKAVGEIKKIVTEYRKEADQSDK